jgi:type II secretory pathway pseudopilin PulG
MRTGRVKSGEKGYVLLALMLAVTLMLIALAVEAPRLAQQIKREREEELIHRGKDYATAIKRFVHKNGGRYPLSIEQLEDTNHIRFLRKRYKDPITGEAEWRLVRFGEAQINIPAPNPGLNPSSTNPGLGGNNLGGSNPTPGGPANSPTPNTTAALVPPGGQLPQTNPGGGQLGSLTTSNIGTGQPIGGGQLIGIASTSKGTAIKEFNDKNHYDEWFFVYDLRLEQSGGTGVTVAAPRVGGSSSTGPSGQGQPTPGGVPQNSGTPAPAPSQNPN